MTQSDLLARYAKKKDAEAFAEIVTQYQRLVFATCRRILRDPADVDDAVQETFLRLAQKASGLHTNLGGWLHSCAANIATDMNRRLTSRSRHETAVVPQTTSEGDSQRILSELREHLDAAIEKLAPDDRELIIQRFFVGRPQIELAKDAGVAPSTITHRIQQAVEALRGHLSALGCGIAAASVVASLLEAEHASAAVPAMLTANIMKIGLTGVSATGLPVSHIMSLLLLCATALIAVLIGIVFYMSSSSGSPVGQLPPSAIQPAMAVPGIHGRVIRADGTPVSGATVLVAFAQPSGIRIRNGRIENDDRRNPRAVTGSDGRYDLPQQRGNFLLQVISNEGYGEADQDMMAVNSDIHLSQWGRISGRMMNGTKPAVGINLQAGSSEPERTGGAMPLSMCNRSRTDSNGNFEMVRVVPGRVLVVRNFEQQSGSNTMTFSGDVGTTEVIAGHTTIVTFGGAGRPVIGKFLFPPGMNPTDYFINARAFPLRNNAASEQQNYLDQYFFDVDADHHFRIDNVPPGEYRIHIFLQKVHGDRTAQPTNITFTVPEVVGGVSDEPLVIPDISLQ